MTGQGQVAASGPGVRARPGDLLIGVENLAVAFQTGASTVHAVQDVSWQLRRGETLGVVGESGSGKSVTALALMGLLPMTGELVSGSFTWQGEPVAAKELAAKRGSRITMVFQDAMSSLNPLVPVGRQVGEVLRKHKGMSRRQAKERTVELFELVGIPEPRRRLRQYPFQFSGGMAQRVMIAMAIAPEPDLIIADEPTTALDVTIQAQIMDLISELQERLDIAMVLITHDLGVVAGVADRIVVMYAGRVLESGPAGAVFEHPLHPYTAGLLASTPHPYEVRETLHGIAGNPPVVTTIQDDCAFANRCDEATDLCRGHRPPLTDPMRILPLAAADGEPGATRLPDAGLQRALSLAAQPHRFEPVVQPVGAGLDEAPPGLVGADALAPPPAHDADAARALLADRPSQPGPPFRLYVTDGMYPGDRKVGEGIAEDWRAVGFDVELTALDLDEYLRQVHDRAARPAFIVGWSDVDDDGTRRPGLFWRGGGADHEGQDHTTMRRVACWHVL